MKNKTSCCKSYFATAFFILTRRLSFAYCSLIVRHILGCASSPTFLRSSFAHRSVKVRANGQINLGVNSLCILLMFSLNLVRVGFRLDLIGCPQGRSGMPQVGSLLHNCRKSFCRLKVASRLNHRL